MCNIPSFFYGLSDFTKRDESISQKAETDAIRFSNERLSCQFQLAYNGKLRSVCILQDFDLKIVVQ